MIDEHVGLHYSFHVLQVLYVFPQDRPVARVAAAVKLTRSEVTPTVNHKSLLSFFRIYQQIFFVFPVFADFPEVDFHSFHDLIFTGFFHTRFPGIPDFSEGFSFPSFPGCVRFGGSAGSATPRHSLHYIN